MRGYQIEFRSHGDWKSVEDQPIFQNLPEAELLCQDVSNALGNRVSRVIDNNGNEKYRTGSEE